AQLDNVVDDLVLEDRSAEAGQSLRVLAVVVVNLLFLTGEAADLCDQRLLMLLVTHLHFILVADLGNDQTQTHAAFSNTLVLFLGGFLGGAFIFEGPAVMLDLMND